MTALENTIAEPDAEFDAMRTVYAALKDLEPPAQGRVLDYVLRRLSLKREHAEPEVSGNSFSPRQLAEEVQDTVDEASNGALEEDEEDLSGVSPVAQKWIRRNGLTAAQLSKLFSIGLDNIDLVARSVPGRSTKERMRNVVLLTGTAAYLGTGAARTDYEALREALSHYNAYDGKNFATYMKKWAAEVSGSKENGYALTPRGLAAAADLVKEMTAPKKA